MNIRSLSVVPALCAILLVFMVGCERAQPSVGANSTNDSESELTPEKVAADPAMQPTGSDPELKIVMLGDSLTAGFGLPSSAALPDQVEKLLNADGFRTDLINAGVSGDTSAGGLARFDWSVGSLSPDLLILALGANDYLSGMDPAQTEANLSTIIELALSEGIDVFLVSISARSSAEADPRAADFAAIYPRLASAFSIPLYEGLLEPIYDQPHLLLPDGLHPSEEGVQIIAAPLAEALETVLTAEQGQH
ncbi:MAG: arylesterase [Henriciella sp.]|nr:arylesterase [Henriciella sp.]